MSRGHRRTLAKFHSCNLPLAIETGRYTGPKTPVNERLCKYCNINAVEDETHIFVDCEFYSNLRYELFNFALCFNNTFKYYSSLDKLVFLMNCDELQHKIASVLSKMTRRRFLVS